MQPYYNILSDKSTVVCASFPDVAQNSAHNIQTHVVSLELLVSFYMHYMQISVRI